MHTSNQPLIQNKKKNTMRKINDQIAIVIITQHVNADVPGHFEDYSVTITASEEDFSDAQVELTVQTASVNTRVSDRDAHLRSSDFFHVDEYPEMTFSSNSIRKIDDGVYEL